MIDNSSKDNAIDFFGKSPQFWFGDRVFWHKYGLVGTVFGVNFVPSRNDFIYDCIWHGYARGRLTWEQELSPFELF